MPVIDLDTTPKRFILPSYANKPAEEQAWVEMPTYPLTSDDYGFVKTDGQSNAVEFGAAVLSRRIKAWNFTNKEGVTYEITPQNVSLLINYTDLTFLFNKIEELPESKRLSDEEKKSS